MSAAGITDSPDAHNIIYMISKEIVRIYEIASQCRHVSQETFQIFVGASLLLV